MEVHHYTLRGRGLLNAVSGRTAFRGVLVRAFGGYGCIHPWPELGDAGLEEEVASLGTPHPGPLARRALECCLVDGAARAGGRSLWTGLTVPESHFTLGPDGAVPDGFHAVKVKAGRGPGPVRERLESLPEHLRIRIDCNGTLGGPDAFGKWWAVLEPWWGRIEFVEDPWPYDPESWKRIEERMGCRFAVDRWEGTVDGDFIRVVKPACRGGWEDLAADVKLVFTSAMDHPVGQLFAAWCAAREFARRPDRVLPGGLVTHHLFEPDDPFVRRLGPPRPVLVPPDGTGLGFDDLLEALPWKPLN